MKISRRFLMARLPRSIGGSLKPACGPGAPPVDVTPQPVDPEVAARLQPRITDVVTTRAGATVSWELNRHRDDIIRAGFLRQHPVMRRHNNGNGTVGVKPHGVPTACGDHGGNVGPKFSPYKVVSVHGDGGCSGVDIGNGDYIAGPADKLAAFLSLSHQVDHRS